MESARTRAITLLSSYMQLLVLLFAVAAAAHLDTASARSCGRASRRNSGSASGLDTSTKKRRSRSISSACDSPGCCGSGITDAALLLLAGASAAVACACPCCMEVLSSSTWGCTCGGCCSCYSNNHPLPFSSHRSPMKSVLQTARTHNHPPTPLFDPPVAVEFALLLPPSRCAPAAEPPPGPQAATGACAAAALAAAAALPAVAAAAVTMTADAACATWHDQRHCVALIIVVLSGKSPAHKNIPATYVFTHTHMHTRACALPPPTPPNGTAPIYILLQRLGTLCGRGLSR
jgi:hypothetical protein